MYIKDRTLIVDDRRSEEGNKWRIDVFKKDDYKCDICKQHGVIHAHHLKSFTKYVEDRYSINNGITLCEEHHIEFHRNYGYKNFTMENYYEFKVEKEEEYGG